MVLAGFLVGCSAPTPAPPQEVPKGGLASVSSSARAQEQPWIDVPDGLFPPESKGTMYEPVVIQEPTRIEDPYESAPVPWKRRDYEPVVILGNLNWIRTPQYGAIANWGTRNDKR